MPSIARSLLLGLYALLDEWNEQGERGQGRAREEEESTHGTGQSGSGQAEGRPAPQDAELYATLDQWNEQHRQREREPARDMSLDMG